MMFGQAQPGKNAGGFKLGFLQRETRQGHILLCVALWSTIMFLVAHRFVVSTVVVQGESMSPTLRPGDRYYVNCWRPYLVDYQRGDIVVIRDHERNDLMVKRIIGVPGDHIQFRKGRVYVNGGLLNEPYVAPRAYTYSRHLANRAVVIGRNSYFVLGDNRLNSEDSRVYGDVARSDLVGIVSP